MVSRLYAYCVISLPNMIKGRNQKWVLWLLKYHRWHSSYFCNFLHHSCCLQSAAIDLDLAILGRRNRHKFNSRAYLDIYCYSFGRFQRYKFGILNWKPNYWPTYNVIIILCRIQIMADIVFFLSANLIGIFTKCLHEITLRRTFLERRKCIDTTIRCEYEKSREV